MKKVRPSIGPGFGVAPVERVSLNWAAEQPQYRRSRCPRTIRLKTKKARGGAGTGATARERLLSNVSKLAEPGSPPCAS